jgi:4-amino-4-deoxy-L-arabinose transferase-like glycosyltransferase
VAGVSWLPEPLKTPSLGPAVNKKVIATDTPPRERLASVPRGSAPSLTRSRAFGWLRNADLESLTLLAILAVAALLRLWRLDQYTTFLGDQGRDALAVREMLRTLDLPIVGPPTSSGNIYFGPAYYYLLIVPMALSASNPVAAAAMVASLGIASVGLLYYLCRAWFGTRAAGVVALLYAVAPVAVESSRTAWNPHPVPFFILLTVVGLWKVHAGASFRWLLLTGASLALVIQMHYSAALFLPVAGLIWLRHFRVAAKSTSSRSSFVRWSILSAALFLLIVSPLLIFEVRNDLYHYRGFVDLWDRETATDSNGPGLPLKMWSIYWDRLVNWSIMAGYPALAPLAGLALLLPLLALLPKFRRHYCSWPYWLLLGWLTVGVGGLSLYRETLHDHYLLFLAPAPFLLLGAAVRQISDGSANSSSGRLRAMLLTGSVLALFGVNLMASPLLEAPNNDIARSQAVARVVIERSGGLSYNLAVVSERTYDAQYRFYLALHNHLPEDAARRVTEQLLLVCEVPECQPLRLEGRARAFQGARVEAREMVEGVAVYKLVRR